VLKCSIYYEENNIRIIGEKGRHSMKSKDIHGDAPEKMHDALLNAKVIEDFLPPLELLIAKDETKKITISLSKKSIDFFKSVSE
jgi:hypothetical protein